MVSCADLQIGGIQVGEFMARITLAVNSSLRYGWMSTGYGSGIILLVTSGHFLLILDTVSVRLNTHFSFHSLHAICIRILMHARR